MRNIAMKVQRLSRKRVHCKPMTVEKGGIQVNLDYDIVCSMWRHIEVHKRTGRRVAPSIEHKDRQTPMGMNWKVIETKDPKTGKVLSKKPDPNADVRQLPNGAGWGYIRDAIKEMVNMFRPYCETLILVGHVKDKQIKKEGEEISEMQLDLAGKSSTIICGEADAIGLIYRKGNSTYMSFENSGIATNEARPLHLRGRKFEVIKSDGAGHMRVDLSQVFPDSETLEKLTKEALTLQSAPLLEETETGKE